MRQEGSELTRIWMAAVVAVLCIGAAPPKDGPYPSEEAARACIHKRLSELIEQSHRDINGDPALAACTATLKAELKKDGKSDCEAIAYSAWLIANENARLSGVSGQAYTPDNAFLKHCESLNKGKKEPGRKQD